MSSLQNVLGNVDAVIGMAPAGSVVLALTSSRRGQKYI